MKIYRAQKGGFCFGVRRAVDKALQCAQGPQPVVTLGPIIHNQQVVDRLARQGVHSASSVEDIPDGAVVVIRSHGVGPQVLEQCAIRGLTVVDATCPCVGRIQRKAQEWAEQGKPVILVGERDHPEVVGISGWCGGKAYVVGSDQDVDDLPPMAEACVAAQTTTPQALWERLLVRLQARIPGLTVFPSICNATAERQEEAADLARRCECIVVVGGKDSSNTAKLTRICRAIQPNTWWVEDAAELPLGELARFRNAGIISGASTPDWIIEEVCAKMSDIENRDFEATAEEARPEVEQQTAVEQGGEAAEPEATPAQVEVPAAPVNSFEEAFERTMRPIHPGQLIKGTVVQVTADAAYVNIGYKADGIVTRDEYASEPVDLLAEVHEGDEIEVEILKINDGEGNVVLSRKNLEVRRGWKLIVDDFEAGNIVKGIGKQVVKGGLIAQVYGVRAFIPASQLDNRYVEDLGEYLNKEMDLKILEVEKHRHRVVASRKAVLEDEKKKHEGETWELLKSHEGDMAKGTVRRLTDFGAFVEVEGIDGLVHVTDLAWGRVKHPSDVVHVGEEINVIILKVDIDRKRLSLSAKMAKPRPWDLAPDRYHVGDIVEGKVVRIVSFGAFVELEPGLDGLVHISQVANRRVEKVEDVLHPEDKVLVRILDVNPEAKRISLSIREAAQDDVVADEDAYSDDSGMVYSSSTGYNTYREMEDNADEDN